MTESALNPIWSASTLDVSGATQVGVLPTRAEKKLIPVEMPTTGVTGASATSPLGSRPSAYEAISYAKATLTDYMTIRIPFRGVTSRDGYDPCYTFRFLINPKTLQVNHQTLDAYSMTRAGFQFGIWGDDTVDLHFNGQTAGQYFENGLTDKWASFTQSYHNLMELVNVFENNGYFFEGEETNSAWNAPDYTRKRIKSHADVVLTVDQFIWFGMFANLTISYDAEHPYTARFDFSFLAWRERFKADPWQDSIHAGPARGHDRSVIEAAQKAAEAATQAAKEASAFYDAMVSNHLLGQGLAASDSLPTLLSGGASMLWGSSAVASSTSSASSLPANSIFNTSASNPANTAFAQAYPGSQGVLK